MGYAIMTTRSLDLNWKMRAFRVLPMFLLPGLSSVAYSALVSFTRMCKYHNLNIFFYFLFSSYFFLLLFNVLSPNLFLGACIFAHLAFGFYLHCWLRCIFFLIGNATKIY